MKRRRIHIWLGSALVIGLPLQAIAQSPGHAGGSSGQGGGRYLSGGERGSILRLVCDAEVQAELDLDENQKSAVAEATKRLWSIESDMAKSLPGADPAARQAQPKDREEVWAQRERLRECRDRWIQLREAALAEVPTARKQVEAVLTPAQRQRLEQISLQVQGPEALSQPEIIRTLELTPAQQQQLAQIRQEGDDTIVRIGQEGPPRNRSESSVVSSVGGGHRTRIATRSSFRAPDTEAHRAQAKEMRRKMSEAERATERRMLEEVLTPQQQSRLKELQGRAFPGAVRFVPPPAVGRSHATGGSDFFPQGPKPSDAF